MKSITIILLLMSITPAFLNPLEDPESTSLNIFKRVKRQSNCGASSSCTSSNCASSCGSSSCASSSCCSSSQKCCQQSQQCCQQAQQCCQQKQQCCQQAQQCCQQKQQCCQQKQQCCQQAQQCCQQKQECCQQSQQCCQQSQQCCQQNQQCCQQKQECCQQSQQICQQSEEKCKETTTIIESRRDQGSSSSSDQTGVTVSSGDSKHDSSNVDVISSVNFTNLVYNKNDVSVPITINNRNELHSDDKSTTGVTSRGSYGSSMSSSGSSGGRITQPDRRVEKVPVYYPVPQPYPVRIPVRVPVHIPIHIPRPVPIPIPVDRPVPVPIPVPVQTHPCYGVQCEVIRPYFHRNVCTHENQCSMHRQDCSGCNSNFYLDQNSYESCYGCFL